MPIYNENVKTPEFIQLLEYISENYDINDFPNHIEMEGNIQSKWIKINFNEYLNFIKRNKVKPRNKSQINNVVQIIDADVYDEKMDQETDSSSEERLHNLLVKYKAIKDEKILAPFPNDTHEKLTELKKKYPHCIDIIDMIDAQIYLQNHTNKPYAKIPHMIFDGEPGSGKTSLARHIANIISPQHYYIDLSLYSEAFQIAGLSLGYSSGDGGLIFKNSSNSKYANNLYICDEAEKSVQDSDRSSPLIPLYQLLEDDTARHFTDVAVGIPMDMSFSSFILTTNNVEFLPEAIRSRCLIFNVPQPSKKMVMENIAVSAWNDILELESWGVAFSKTLSKEIRNHLGSISVREIKKQLKLAAANAAKRNHKPQSKINLLLNDFIMDKLKKTKSSIGFICN